MRNSSNNLKILGLIDEEPFHYRTWSGSSKYLFSALNKANLLHAALSTKPKSLISYLCKIATFHPNLTIWKHKYHLYLPYLKIMSYNANKQVTKVDKSQYDVILQIGALLNLTKSQDKIYASYHDGNLHALIKSPYQKHLTTDTPFVQSALKYEKNIYDKVDLIFTMSDWLATSFINDFNITPSKIVTVGAGINLPFLAPPKGKNYSSPEILFIGKVFERKGGDTLLKAFETVKQELPDATLTIIGPTLKNAPPGVICLGYLHKNNEKDLKRLTQEYSKASVFVMPSLYEPFGIVFAEAMSFKLPCIGTNNCAMPEIIDDGKSGYIVTAGDSIMLANKIISILKSPEKAKEMGENGYIKYKLNFTWDAVVQKMLDTINSRYN